MQQSEDPWAMLLRAANAGDGRAYASFLRAVTPVVRGIVRARGRALPPDQHEDVVQEVLLGLHLKRHTWHPDHPVRPWVYAITRHKVVDAFRRRGAAIHLPIGDFSDTLAAEAEAGPLDARDDRREVDRLIAQLDPRSAELIRRISLQGQPPAEVGDALQMSAVNVRVALHRAMKRLAALGRKDPP